MTIEDIYGEGIGDILPKDIIASNFGKVGRMDSTDQVDVHLFIKEKRCFIKFVNNISY